jgi:hypothetical protein|tara:strand:- start:248 stop:1066 length:819 start_codon:yes stop_codon:yes gene_type:complete
MSFIVAGIAAGAVLVGSTAYGAYKGSQQGKAYDDALAAAGDIKAERLDVAREQKSIGMDITKTGYGSALSAYQSGQTNIGMGANMQLRRAQAFGAQAQSQSGLATSGTIENRLKAQTGDLMAKYKTDMTKLFETKELAGKERDIGVAKINKSFWEDEITAEQAYQDTIAGLDDSSGWSGAAEGFGAGIGTAVQVGTAVSDRRLKENIDYIGDSPSGIKIYEFNYVDKDTRYRGAIANELADSHPSAVSKNKDGYYMLDYSKIDVDFEIVKGA